MKFFLLFQSFIQKMDTELTIPHKYESVIYSLFTILIGIAVFLIYIEFQLRKIKKNEEK